MVKRQSRCRDNSIIPGRNCRNARAEPFDFFGKLFARTCFHAFVEQGCQRRSQTGRAVRVVNLTGLKSQTIADQRQTFIFKNDNFQTIRQNGFKRFRNIKRFRRKRRGLVLRKSSFIVFWAKVLAPNTDITTAKIIILIVFLILLYEITKFKE